jgi:hypothetical protein
VCALAPSVFGCDALLGLRDDYHVGDSATGGDSSTDATGGDSSTDVVINGDAGPIGFVQPLQNSSSGPTNNTMLGISFKDPPQGGNMIVLFIGWQGSATVQSVTDAANIAYTVSTLKTEGTTYQQVAFGKVPATPASGAMTITFTSADANQIDVRGLECTGVGAVVSADDDAGALNGATASASVTITANSFLVAGGYTSGQFIDAASPGFVLDPMNDINPLGILEHRTASAGTYDAQVPLNGGTRPWIFQLYAFQ